MHLSLPVSTCETLKRSAQWTSRLARISSTGFALPSAAPTRLAYAHARLRYELARWSAQQVRGRCLTKPDKVLHRQLSDASIIQTKCTKSNIVPAPGLEPGRSQLQRLVGCQLPYAGSTHTLLRINEYRDRESTIPAGPPSRYPRIPGHPWLVCYSFGARRPLMPAAACASTSTAAQASTARSKAGQPQA